MVFNVFLRVVDGQSEIDNFDLLKIGIRADQNIGWFEIAVHDILLEMQVLDSLEDSFHNK